MCDAAPTFTRGLYRSDPRMSVASSSIAAFSSLRRRSADLKTPCPSCSLVIMLSRRRPTRSSVALFQH